MENLEIIDKPRLLTIKEAAKLIPGLTVYGLNQLCNKGQMPYIAFGNKKLINEKVLFETIEKLSRQIPAADDGNPVRK